VAVDEGPPCRDGAGRVTSQVRHVGELHRLRVAVEDGAQRGDLGGIDGDQDRLAGRDSITDEGGCAGEEIAFAGVEECLVAKTVVYCHRL
jgi:hypothetical protein